MLDIARIETDRRYDERYDERHTDHAARRAAPGRDHPLPARRNRAA